MLKWKEFPVFTISIYMRMKMETAAFFNTATCSEK